MTRLAVFDLDNTLLTGDSEVLWVKHLLERGLLPAHFATSNAQMDQRYHAGLATPGEFSAFYASTLSGRTPDEWAPVLAGFVHGTIRPRIPDAARALVHLHRECGDLLVLSTASSRYLSEPTAKLLGFEHLIATELQVQDDGRFTGATEHTLNMREGKVERLRAWLAARGDDADAALAQAVFYSDSINDLPLLMAVREPVAVDPDPRLSAEAAARRWPVLKLDRGIPSSP
ncbi:MAG: HAD-IB family hydrolase [Comamonadaceae bacterium]|nr:MAG: HAD-IB family hydrolase [Comamonadaceae bacterium]